jgi:hypothetical protein
MRTVTESLACEAVEPRARERWGFELGKWHDDEALGRRHFWIPIDLPGLGLPVHGCGRALAH